MLRAANEPNNENICEKYDRMLPGIMAESNNTRELFQARTPVAVRN